MIIQIILQQRQSELERVSFVIIFFFFWQLVKVTPLIVYLCLIEKVLEV